MQTEQKKRVGILGGTFDPPTVSHLAIAQEALNQNAVDEVWIVPCGIRVDKITQTSPKNRMAMLEIAINEIYQENPRLKGKILCNDIEVRNEKTIPTYFLMKILEEKQPEIDFYFLIGHDLIKGLTTWDEGDKLVEEIKFVIAGQPSIDWSCFEGYYPKNYKKITIQVDVRSTNYRKIIQESYQKNNNTFITDLGLGKGLLSQKIMEFIIENKLYVQQQ